MINLSVGVEPHILEAVREQPPAALRVKVKST